MIDATRLTVQQLEPPWDVVAVTVREKTNVIAYGLVAGRVTSIVELRLRPRERQL
jgi:hypothetical protein